MSYQFDSISKIAQTIKITATLGAIMIVLAGCVSSKEEGEGCLNSLYCVAGLYCDADTKVCTPRTAKAGESCVLARTEKISLSLASTTFVASGDCADPNTLYCNQQTNSCAPLVALGGDCVSGGHIQCALDLYCNEKGTCVSPRLDGGGVREKLKLPEGARCSRHAICESEECFSNSFLYTTCQPNRNNGEACFRDSDCKSSICDGVTDRCAAEKRNSGERCSSFADCKSNSCPPLTKRCQ